MATSHGLVTMRTVSQIVRRLRLILYSKLGRLKVAALLYDKLLLEGGFYRMANKYDPSKEFVVSKLHSCSSECTLPTRIA